MRARHRRIESVGGSRCDCRDVAEESRGSRIVRESVGLADRTARVAVNAVLMKLQGKSLPVVFLDESSSDSLSSDRRSLAREAAGSGLESELFLASE